MLLALWPSGGLTQAGNGGNELAGDSGNPVYFAFNPTASAANRLSTTSSGEKVRPVGGPNHSIVNKY
jgi:hypothetical protein